MRVRDIMTENVITVDEDFPILDAKRIMLENRIRRLPVMKKGKLAGLVTERMLIEACPSPASSLSIYEMTYLLSKMTVSELMVKNPVTVNPGMPAEEALMLGQEKGYGAFPVVEDGRLVGIITESDIIRMMVRALGLLNGGVRVDIVTEKTFGNLQKIMRIIDDKKIPLISIMGLNSYKNQDEYYHIFIRLKYDNVKEIVEELTRSNFSITDWDDNTKARKNLYFQKDTQELKPQLKES